MQPLTAQDREADENEIYNMAKQALRNIALCYTDLDEDPNRDWESPKPDETEKFILIGFLGIEDPVRPEVPEAVRMCQKAGIKVHSRHIFASARLWFRNSLAHRRNSHKYYVFSVIRSAWSPATMRLRPRTLHRSVVFTTRTKAAWSWKAQNSGN
jgi:hypothetical protein